MRVRLGKGISPRLQSRAVSMRRKSRVAPHMNAKIAIRPQPNAYEGVKHSVTQKVTELRGEAHLLPT